MNWTITMAQEELNRKTVIEQVIDKRISQKEGAGKLRISERHFRHVLKSYRQAGDAGLVSGHRWESWQPKTWGNAVTCYCEINGGFHF